MKEEYELKVKSLEFASALHCSPIANGDKKNPSDVIATAKDIHEWLIAK